MKPLHLGGAGVLTLVALAPALLSFGSSSAPDLSPQLGRRDRRKALVPVPPSAESQQ